MDACIKLLADLVAIDSVNPALVPGAAGEGAICAFIAAIIPARRAATISPMQALRTE